MNVQFKGHDVSLEGTERNTGDTAPDFTVVSGGMDQTRTLDDLLQGGKKHALLIAVPSLDTGVCSIESQKFNSRLGELPDDVAAYVVSRDLPFAQSRWCGAQQEGVKLTMLSDARDHAFGPAFGIVLKGLGLLARSVFIVSKDKRISYKQIVPEVTNEPDYDAVFAAAKNVSQTVNA